VTLSPGDAAPFPCPEDNAVIGKCPLTAFILRMADLVLRAGCGIITALRISC
jgi:hypothetical protein